MAGPITLGELSLVASPGISSPPKFGTSQIPPPQPFRGTMGPGTLASPRNRINAHPRGSISGQFVCQRQRSRQLPEQLDLQRPTVGDLLDQRLQRPGRARSQLVVHQGRLRVRDLAPVDFREVGLALRCRHRGRTSPLRDLRTAGSIEQGRRRSQAVRRWRQYCEPGGGEPSE